MSKVKFGAQAEKLKNLVDFARLQTSSSAVTATAPSQSSEGAEGVSGRPMTARTKAKNLKAVPLSYFEAHAELKATSKTSLDFSSYTIEAIKEKLKRDGAIGQQTIGYPKGIRCVFFKCVMGILHVPKELPLDIFLPMMT